MTFGIRPQMMDKLSDSGGKRTELFLSSVIHTSLHGLPFGHRKLSTRCKYVMLSDIHETL